MQFPIHSVLDYDPEEEERIRAEWKVIGDQRRAEAAKREQQEQAAKAVPSADDFRPTPVEQREGLIEEFRRKNGNCAIKQICYWANVSREDFNKWKNGRPEVPVHPP